MSDFFKQLAIKYASTMMIILTILGFGYFGISMYFRAKKAEIQNEALIGQVQGFNKLNSFVGELQRKYVDQAALLKQMQDEFGKVTFDSGEHIKIVGGSSFNENSGAEDSKADYKDPNGKYYLLEAHAAGNNSLQSGPPISLTQVNSDGTSSTRAYSNAIQVDFAVSEDDDGKFDILTKAYYVLTEPDVSEKYAGKKAWNGTAYPLDITNGSASIDPTTIAKTQKFYWFAPHINTGLNIGAEGGTLYDRFSIGTSWMGYGNTKNDLKWKFLGTGIGFNYQVNKFDFHLYPFLYRPFDEFISNTYIGPVLSFSGSGTGYGVGISFGL